MVVVGLGAQGFGEHGALGFLVAFAQRRAQVVFVVGEQAGPQLAVRREAQAVALPAEMALQRRDEPDRALRPREHEVAGRPPA